MTRWLIASGDFTTLGGMDSANHALASYLARTGRDVHLVAHRVADDLARTRGVSVHLAPRPLGAHLLGAPFLAREAARQACALGPDAAVLINGGNASLPAATWIHYLHAAFVPERGGSLRSRLTRALGRRRDLRHEARAIARAPLVICNSRRTADDVARHHAGARDRTRVIYYGSTPQFAPVSAAERGDARRALGVGDGRLAAVFIGALGDRRKGFDVLFDAWRDLSSDRGWDVDLLVAGTGAEAGAWTRRAAAAGIGDRVRLLGFRTDIPQVLAAADVLVHPARYEAYGLGIHEAICRGIPAVITEICGIAERYPATLAGLVVPSPPDARTLAVALRAWRSAADTWPARVAPFGDALRARTWDHMAADIATAVEAL